MTTLYLLEYDSDDNGTFSDDLSSDVLALEWSLGMAEPYQSMAAPATAMLTLRNPDGRYSPGQPACALEVGHWLRIRSIHNGVTRTHFVGMLHTVTPTPGEYGERQSVLQLVCPLEGLRRTTVRLAAQQQVTVDALARTILAAARPRLRYLAGAFQVGISGHNAVGINTRLPTAGALLAEDFQAGKSVLAYVGDTWGAGVNAWDALREGVEAERGRFYVEESGAFALLNRHALVMAPTPAATLTNSMDGLTLQYGQETVSRAAVIASPRAVSNTESVLWRLSAPIAVKPNQNRQFTAHFGNADASATLAALRVTPPRPYTDYTASTHPFGQGNDSTSRLALELVGYDATSAQMQLRSSGTSAVLYLLAGSVIRGQAVSMGNAMAAEVRDGESETRYGTHTYTLKLPGISTLDEAEDIARYELARRRSPRITARTLTLRSQAHRQRVLSLRLFDAVRIMEAQSGHTGDYWLVGALHRVELGGARHSVVWVLEPV
ncbi:MAG: hypothetical protein ACOYL5_02945, partial [Phototrophicaceae bacterium]